MSVLHLIASRTATAKHWHMGDEPLGPSGAPRKSLASAPKLRSAFCLRPAGNPISFRRRLPRGVTPCTFPAVDFYDWPQAQPRFLPCLVSRRRSTIRRDRSPLSSHFRLADRSILWRDSLLSQCAHRWVSHWSWITSVGPAAASVSIASRERRPTVTPSFSGTGPALSAHQLLTRCSLMS